MVGRGDDDAVDVGPVQDLAEIPVVLASGVRAGGLLAVGIVDEFLGARAAVVIDIADGQDLDVAVAQKAAHEAAASAAHADMGDADAVGGRRPAGRTQRGGRQNVRRRHRHRSRPQKFPPRAASTR